MALDAVRADGHRGAAMSQLVEDSPLDAMRNRSGILAPSEATAASAAAGADPAAHAPKSALDADAVRAAYSRWAGIYDVVFGGVSAVGRRRAVASVNRLPGTQVLEVGVGTGLALPHYTPDKRITGIDLSTAMLDRARQRQAALRLGNVDALLEMDAEETVFPDNSFDIAVAMFVASVVPNPRRLLAELKRVVRPDGHILFVNHFLAPKGPRLVVERAMARASRSLGWHPDFAFEALLPPDDLAAASFEPVPPLGLFTLVTLRNQGR
jgi:phosphatidylethanolamine/phosphatidyl-N-methylethanolamine N-methyltransferase